MKQSNKQIKNDYEERRMSMPDNVGYNYGIKVETINPIDVNHMFVAKYQSRGRPSEKEQNNKKKRNTYKKIEEEIRERIDDHVQIERKERSLQEHMSFMIWIGRKNANIMSN